MHIVLFSNVLTFQMVHQLWAENDLVQQGYHCQEMAFIQR